jgi:plasmid stabilization system protein ParE
MRFRVVITRRALREIDAALEWLAERSPPAAARWHRRLLDAIDSLESNPERCSLAPESDWFPGGEIRQLLYGKRGGVYRILFEVRGDTVVILRVRHQAQDLLPPEEW